MPDRPSKACFSGDDMPEFHDTCGGSAQTAPHTHQPPPSNSQKSTKSAVSHPASPYAVATPHRSPYGPYSHTISLTRRSPRPARALAGLQSTHGGSSRQLASYPPRPAAGPLKPTRPIDLLKFPAPTRGAWASGYGVASRCDDGVAATSTTVGPAPACVIGLSGLGARLQSSLKA